MHGGSLEKGGLRLHVMGGAVLVVLGHKVYALRRADLCSHVLAQVLVPQGEKALVDGQGGRMATVDVLVRGGEARAAARAALHALATGDCVVVRGGRWARRTCIRP